MIYPSATYRIQFNHTFTFQHLKNIIPYLSQLGITAIYASPVTQAVQGSMHGYDVVNPQQLNAEIGTLEEWEEISAMLHKHNMLWIQDLVPNHMAYSSQNTRLMDVFERGNASPYKFYFDINWEHSSPELNQKLMAPFLGNDLSTCIYNNEIKLSLTENGFFISYFENSFPASLASYQFILLALLQQNELPYNLQNSLQQLLSVATQFFINDWTSYKKNWIKQNLFNSENNWEENIKNVNANHQFLKELLPLQQFCFTHWKQAEAEINYRRFFTVNTLICLRMENDFVFEDYHKSYKEWYEHGLIQGFRIDHIDGLYHPIEYVERLRNTMGNDCYIIAEKILGFDETMTTFHQLHGTSGYEFLSYANQLLTFKNGGNALRTFYTQHILPNAQYDELVFNSKHHFLWHYMKGELHNLINYIQQLHLLTSFNEFSLDELAHTLANFMAGFPLYRIYPSSFPLTPQSLSSVEQAVQTASKKENTNEKALQFLQHLFYLSPHHSQAKEAMSFLMRLMQFTGPLAAKGVEDTVFYIYNPLISHNEVGDSPARLGITVEEFHHKMLYRCQYNSTSLNATSTHDTKRGEDARMRINILSEMPEEWQQVYKSWQQINEPYIHAVQNERAPSVNDEYFIYQSLLGSFPENEEIDEDFIQRTLSFIEKALREAKVHTTHEQPNEAYENACKQFVLLLFNQKHGFLNLFLPFYRKVHQLAMVYSLIQTVIKITAPGIPDIYQGCELWNLSYVDPDNRRLVDFHERIQLLEQIASFSNIQEKLLFLQQYKHKGAEKMYVTQQALQLRKQWNNVFSEGTYIPLTANKPTEIIVYARCWQQKWILVAAPLYWHELNKQNAWQQAFTIELPGNAPLNWKHVFTSEQIMANNQHQLILSFQFPVALLIATE